MTGEEPVFVLRKSFQPFCKKQNIYCTALKGEAVTVEWCACFVSWCADQCGYLDSGAVPAFSLCSDGVDWFQARGRFVDGSYVPVAGDIIFFDWEEDGGVDHVGIVESVESGMVHTIEGNSGNAVKRRRYSIGDSRIYGYGVLTY